MAKVITLQASFVAGEFDPTLFGRVDIGDYKNGAGKLRNVYVRPQGGAFRREGCAFFADLNGVNVKTRLVPFQFNEEQTYILAFQAGRMDVYKTDTPEIIQDTLTNSPISGLTQTIVDEMNFTQSADTLILFHKDLQPIRITRTSDTAWTAVNTVFKNIPPFAFGVLTVSNPAGSIVPDVVSGRVIITGTGTAFDATFVGQFLNLPKGGRIFITKFTSTTEIEGTVIVELASTSSVATGDWEKEAGYEDVISVTRGWARSGTFHKSRLVLGGLGQRPQTILMSKVGDFFNLDIGEALDDEGIDITIDDDKVNAIRNVFSGRGLNVFTSGGEFSIQSAVGGALTPKTIAQQITKETRHGSARVRPVSVDGAVVFVEGEDPLDASKGSIFRQFIFNDTEQSFAAPNISIFSQSLLSNPVSMDIRRSTQAQPATYLYVVNDNGTVAVLNSLREQDLLAWTLFETTGTFEDVAVSGNRVFFVVTRTIGGTPVKYLEVLDDKNFMDSSKRQVDSPAKTAWDMLDHLNGETVKVRGDNFILDDAVVSGGALTSSEAVLVLEAGLNFSAKIVSLPLEIATEGGSSAGSFKTAIFANVRLFKSRNIIINQANFINRPAFRVFGEDVLDEPISLFTGWKKVYIGGSGREVEIEITQDQPLEFNVLSIQFGVRT